VNEPAQDGYDEFGPRTGGIDKRRDEAIAGEIALVKPKIGNMDDLFAFNDAIERSAGILAYVNHRLPAIVGRIVRLAAIARAANRDIRGAKSNQ
jgi:hypothetical protein